MAKTRGLVVAFLGLGMAGLGGCGDGGGGPPDDPAGDPPGDSPPDAAIPDAPSGPTFTVSADPDAPWPEARIDCGERLFPTDGRPVVAMFANDSDVVVTQPWPESEEHGRLTVMRAYPSDGGPGRTLAEFWDYDWPGYDAYFFMVGQDADYAYYGAGDTAYPWMRHVLRVDIAGGGTSVVGKDLPFLRTPSYLLRPKYAYDMPTDTHPLELSLLLSPFDALERTVEIAHHVGAGLVAMVTDGYRVYYSLAAEGAAGPTTGIQSIAIDGSDPTVLTTEVGLARAVDDHFVYWTSDTTTVKATPPAGGVTTTLITMPEAITHVQAGGGWVYVSTRSRVRAVRWDGSESFDLTTRPSTIDHASLTRDGLYFSDGQVWFIPYACAD